MLGRADGPPRSIVVLVCLLLVVPASQEAEQREDENDDQDDPQERHVFSSRSFTRFRVSGGALTMLFASRIRLVRVRNV